MPTHILRAALPANTLNSQRRRWVKILEAHGRSDAKLLVEGVESVDELAAVTKLSLEEDAHEEAGEEAGDEEESDLGELPA